MREVGTLHAQTIGPNNAAALVNPMTGEAVQPFKSAARPTENLPVWYSGDGMAGAATRLAEIPWDHRFRPESHIAVGIEQLRGRSLPAVTDRAAKIGGIVDYGFVSSENPAAANPLFAGIHADVAGDASVAGPEIIAYNLPDPDLYGALIGESSALKSAPLHENVLSRCNDQQQ